MAPEPLLVFQNGVSLQPSRYVVERARLGVDAALARLGGAVVPAASALGCPISESGALDTAGRYRDPQVATLGYYLPAYATNVSRATEAPFSRYDVKLELTPDVTTAGRIWVRLEGERRDGDAQAQLGGRLRFDAFPDGRPIAEPTILRGDDYGSLGLRFSGAPQDAYCAEARSAAVTPARHMAPAASLTPCAPDDPLACTGVPIEITFAEAVSSVTLQFFGAALPYALKAFDAQGNLLAEAQRAPAKAYQLATVGLSVADNRIARLAFGHFGSARAGTAITELAWERKPAAAAPTELRPLPHTVAVSLRYLAMASGGAGSTWKSVPFEEVTHREYQHVEAVARLRTLPEVDAVHRALVDPAARGELLVRCEAELAVKRRQQIYVPRKIGAAVLPPGAIVKLHELVTAQPKLEQLLSGKRLSYPRPRPEPRPIPDRPTPADLRRGEDAPRRDAGGGAAMLPRRAVTLARGTPAVADALPLNDAVASRFLGDAAGEPAYVKLRLAHEQHLAFQFDPGLHAYVYPPRAAAAGPALVSHQVGSRVIYQDVAQRHVFYYLPDEFRIARDNVRSPTYRPSMHIAFFSTTAQGAGDDEATAEYGVQFTFRAVPYLDPAQEAEARRVIRDQALAPDGTPPSLVPLTPEWAELTLNLPVEGGAGTRAEARPEATIVFDRYVVDSLALSASAFAEVFQSMRAGGETLNGTVRFRLGGSTLEHGIPFSGRLDKLVGPVVDAELEGQAPIDGGFRVRISNGIESAVTLREALVRLLDDPDHARWTLAPVGAGFLPLALASNESRLIDVRPGAALVGAYGVRVTPTRLEVALDFEKLWMSVLETPGWDDVTQPVAVSVDGSCFSGASALDRVTVAFNAGEAQVELTAASPKAEVKLIRNFLAYLLRRETTDDYLYRVESWRRPTSGAAPVKVAETGWIQAEGPVLAVTPPAG